MIFGANMSGEKLGQILRKLCVCFRGHIFCPIICKVGLNVCPDDISKQFENESVGSKTRSTDQILEISCVGS